jgi:hypothetical protein
MSTTRDAPRIVMTASFTVVLVIAALLWAATVANTITIRSSDAAGNGLSHAFGVLIAILLWVLLAILVILAAARGEMPGWMRVAAVVLVPASGAATIGAIEIMSQGTEWPVKWPLAVPILAPGLLIGMALWAYVPSLRAMAPASIVGGVVWGSLALLSVAPWPLLRERGRIRGAGPGELQAIRQAKLARLGSGDRERERAEFEAIEPTAPLYEWLAFTEPGDPLRERAIAAIHKLPDRQREVEEMVRAGNVNAIREIPALSVEATPALCDAAREAIVFHARRVRPEEGEPAATYAKYSRDVEFYMPTVEWLVQRGCSLTDGLSELETTAKAYPDSPERARFLARIDELRRTRRPVPRS